MKKHLLLLASLLLFGIAAIAQTSLQGKVIDEENDEPIIFGNVAVYRNGVLITGAQTDVDGNYSISLDPGTYTVDASYTGYGTVRTTDVLVLAGKVNTLDINMQSGVALETVIVTEYRKPLIEKDNTTSGGVVTSEEISKLPIRNINALAATTAGLGSADEGDAVTVRGSRTDATNYYIDGIRVQGNLVQESEIDQLQVITGGIEARYGDVTGGIISITTKGPSDQFSGGIQAETSRFLDNFNNNLLDLNLSGPILKNKSGQSVLGFRVSGRYTYNEDDNPSAVPIYRINDDRLAELEANPVILRGGAPFVAADFLTNADVTPLTTRPFESRNNLNLNGKLDARLSNAIDVSLSGGYFDQENQFTPDENSQASNRPSWRTLNSHNNPIRYDGSYRVNFRFRHRLGGNNTNNASSSTIQNANYIIQVGVENETFEVSDPLHGDNFFQYGHVGRYDVDYIPIFQPVRDSLGILGLQHVDYREVLRGYDPTVSSNPVLSNYNNVLGLTAGEGINSAQPDYGLLGIGGGGLTLDQFIAQNGLTNNVYNNSWNFHSNVGTVFNQYRTTDDDILIGNLNAGFDIVPGGSEKGRHSIQLGLAYEGRTNRSYQVNPRRLWIAARQNANIHIPAVDAMNGDTLGIIDVDLGPNLPSQAAVIAPTVIEQPDGQFYRAVRDALGIPLNQFVNVDGLDPSQLSLSMFSAKELNDQNNILDYYGYDYLGNEFDGTFNDFFNLRDPSTGLRLFPVAPNRPQYFSGYLQDKFTFRDIIFRLGVRVDRYDANTQVLKDPYSLYEIMTAADFHDDFPNAERPGNIGDDYVVYTTEDNGGSVRAYRRGDDWFQADGTPTNGPQEIEGIRTGLVFPKYANPRAHEVANFIKDESFTVESSFQDYEVQLNVMPRLAFSFPISDDANFFAHYDILVQRPPSNTIATALDYFYFVERTGSSIFNNPNLRPERTVDYEVGFQQRLSNSSAIKIAAYYKEMRDMIQVRTFFPVPLVNQYTTYDNQDFGTVKGFTFQYDLRRTNNFLVNANYTLQFADGTGSDANSQRGLSNRGNLRTLFPLNFDERHRINLILDYRYGRGKNYNGPRIGDMELFADAGINLQTIAVSGRPYTAEAVARELGGDGIAGAINGSRQPWNLFLNARIDKTFQLNDALGVNVFLRVSNLLDRRNVIDVYSVSGSPTDDGFLQSRFGQDQIRTIQGSSRPLESYLASYQWRLLNSDFFSLPRRIFLGANFNF